MRTDRELDPPPRTVDEVIWQRMYESPDFSIEGEEAHAAHTGQAGGAKKSSEDKVAIQEVRRLGDEFERRLQALNKPSKTRRPHGSKETHHHDIREWCDELDAISLLYRNLQNRNLKRRTVSEMIRTVRLPFSCIDSFGERLNTFRNLEMLNLDMNSIDRLIELPTGLASLSLNFNSASTLDYNLPRFPSLKFMALAFNRIETIPRHIEGCLPCIRILDISFNGLCDFDNVLDGLCTLLSLSHLFLLGNPIALLPFYRNRILYAMPDLKQLDDIHVDPADVPVDPPLPIPFAYIRTTIHSVTGLPISSSSSKEDDDDPGQAFFEAHVFGAEAGGAFSDPVPWGEFITSTKRPGINGGGGSGCGRKVAAVTSTPVSLDLRDGIKFKGVRVSLFRERVHNVPPPQSQDSTPVTSDFAPPPPRENDDDSTKRYTADGEGNKGGKGRGREGRTKSVQLVGTACISAEAFLEPCFTAKSSKGKKVGGSIDECARLNLELSEQTSQTLTMIEKETTNPTTTTPPLVVEIRLSLELNPPDLLEDLERETAKYADVQTGIVTVKEVNKASTTIPLPLPDLRDDLG